MASIEGQPTVAIGAECTVAVLLVPGTVADTFVAVVISKPEAIDRPDSGCKASSQEQVEAVGDTQASLVHT